MAINVNITGLTSLANQIGESLDSLNEANKAASRAGAAAVTAAGGSSTDVGKAIEDAIQKDTENEFGQALKIVSEMTSAMKTVSNTYSAENDELLSKIKTIAARNGEQQQQSSNPGSSSSATE